MLCFSRTRIRLLLLAWSAIAFSIPLSAAAETQAGSQNTAANTNHKGSDDDQDEAVRNAMKAFMNLAALNIPGAISKGYQAYGNYINSQTFDDLEAKTKALKGKMTTEGFAIGLAEAKSQAATQVTESKSGVSGTSKTTTLRVEPNSLYKGETAAIAEEFEKRSGMKREEFLKHLTSVSEAGYTWDDPNLKEKLEQRWAAFKERVPNKEFRDGLQRAENMVPDAMRVKMMGEAMAFYKETRFGSGKNVAAASNSGVSSNATGFAPIDPSAAPSAGPTASSGVAAASGAAITEEQPAADRAPAAVAAPKQGVYPEKVGFYIGMTGGQDALKEFFQSADIDIGEDSIFKAVSRRYRKLTPGLVAKKNIGDSR